MKSSSTLPILKEALNNMIKREFIRKIKKIFRKN
jgi:hypothetical protein